jgi:drug/metabolite transporter (DMT)-like permease
MSLLSFSLVMLAGLIHALWNIAAKRAGGDSRFAFFTSFLMMGVWAPAGLWMGWGVINGWGAAEWGLITLSGLLHVVYYVTLLRGYQRADLTVVYPLARGSGPLLSSAVALLLLGEQLTASSGLGLLGVVLGVFLVAGGPGLWRAGRSAEHQARVRLGLVYGLLTGAFIASYTVVDGYAVKVMLMSPVLIDYMGNFVRVAALAPQVWRDRPEAARLWRLQWKHALLVACISPVSYVLVLYAMQTAPLSHVAPAREVSMLFAALIGGHLLGEGDRLARVGGAVLIAAGVVLLGLG